MKNIEQLKKKDLNCNIFSVYDYDGLTITELLCQFFTKINECIDVSNETIDLAKWLVNEGLEIEVAKKLVMWLEDGTLENIINVNLFNSLNEKINGLSSQLEHVETNIYGVKNIKEYESLVSDNDWIDAFEQATLDCNNYGYDLYIPAGTYEISRTWYIPKHIRIYGSGQKTRIIANNEFCQKSLNASYSIVSSDNEGQPPYKLSHVYIGASETNKLNGLQIGGSRCSEFSHIVTQNLGGSGVLVFAQNPNSGDIENFTLKHIWTNKVYEGLTIKTNKNINRGHITDGQVMYCQFTTLDEAYTQNSGYAINIVGDTSRYLFGVTFTRCFVHSRLNSLINIENEEGSIVYDLHFNHIKGELWGENRLGDDVSNVYALKVKNLKNSSFTDNFIYENNSKGMFLSNSKYNKFDNCFWNYLVNKTANYIYLDEKCCFNNININIDNAYYESKSVYANYAFDLFKTKIIDLGYSNFINNSVIKNNVKLINEPDKLFDVNDGLLTNYNNLSQGYTAEIVDGNLKIVLKAGVQDARIIIPINISNLKHVGFYLKYKIDYNFNETLQAGISGLSKPLLKDNEEHELCLVFDNTIFNYNYYYIRCKSGESLLNDVTITIYDWEVYEGFVIPYLPNYTCLH